MKSNVSLAPTVSIITPSYNQGNFIEETIVSVLSQQGDFFLDYIVMDGGSTDNSVEIIKKYDLLLQENNWPVACRGITYRWVSRKDRGQADAVNNGAALSKGEILGWLNSDDTYLPGALATVSRYFRTSPDSIMVYGNAYYTDKEGVVTSSYPVEPFRLLRLAETCFICQPAAFLKAEIMTAVNGLDVSLQASMDYDLWIRLGKRYADRIVYIDNYLATSRMYPENKTNAIRDRVLRENLVLMQKHFGYIEGTHVASCFYDIYKNPDKLSLYDNVKKLFRRLAVIQYLFNGKTFISTLRYFIFSVKKLAGKI